MTDDPAQTVTEILRSDDVAGRSEELLPLIYDELRRLARQRMASERSDHTLEPTALVHEAYVRLVHGESDDVKWSGRGHFFGSAARAMQRILVDHARKKNSLKRGGDRARITLEAAPALDDDGQLEEVLMLDEVLTKLEAIDPRKAEIVRLRYFAGLSVDDTASALDVSRTTIKSEWAFARAWLLAEMGAET